MVKLTEFGRLSIKASRIVENSSWIKLFINNVSHAVLVFMVIVGAWLCPIENEIIALYSNLMKLIVTLCIDNIISRLVIGHRLLRRYGYRCVSKRIIWHSAMLFIVPIIIGIRLMTQYYWNIIAKIGRVTNYITVFAVISHKQNILCTPSTQDRMTVLKSISPSVVVPQMMMINIVEDNWVAGSGPGHEFLILDQIIWNN